MEINMTQKPLSKAGAITKLTIFSAAAIGMSSGGSSFSVAMVVAPLYLIGLYFISKGYTNWLSDKHSSYKKPICYMGYSSIALRQKCLGW
jgi:hypothetical protein